MKKLIVGLLAVLPFAVFAVLTSSASAAPEWLCGGQAILTSGNCVVSTENLGVLLLEDRGVHSGMECTVGAVAGAGSITTSTKGSTTSVTFGAGCTAPATALNLKEEAETNACEKVESIVAENLPWTSTISEEESGLWWILVESSTAGKGPAYKTTCQASKIKGIADLCESESTHTPLVLGENLAEEETVESVKILLFSIFFVNPPLEGEPEWATCSLGGAHQGIVEGENLLTALIASKPASLEIS